MRWLWLTLLGLATVLGTGSGLARATETNLLRNGDFAVDSDRDGMADDWHFAGDPGVTATWPREAGRGPASQCLTGTSFPGPGSGRRVTLAQDDTFSLVEGRWYALSFSVKGQALTAVANAAIQHLDSRESVMPAASFRLRPEWRHQSFRFRAPKATPGPLRLQIWFWGPGTMWVDAVKLVEEAGPEQTPHYTETLPDLGSKNLIPNGSFECGTSGWGSIGETTGYAGGTNVLQGKLDRRTAAVHGTSFRMDLDKAHPSMLGWDFFEALRRPLLFVAVANRGWITVEPGTSYTLSAFVKSAPADAPCVLAVQEAFGGLLRQEVQASEEWQRVSFSFTPRARQVYVGVGLKLRHSALARATLWVDAVQLERGARATAYEPRAPVEVGLEWEAPGHLFASPARARLVVTAFNAGKEPAQVHAQGAVTDFFDRPASAPGVDLTLAAGQAARKTVPLGVSAKGFYRVTLAVEGGTAIPTRPERFAVLDAHADARGLFGMNHAYPTPELLALSKRIGLTWFRDWSLKWQQVEPEQGHFSFAETDFQVARVRRAGLNVLGLLPFPASEWSSAAPAGVAASEDMGEHVRQAYRPRDLREYAAYVRRTVAEYRDRIHVWEVMNEPLYTGTALPASAGYTVADYVAQLQVAFRAIKETDPQAIVIGGIGGEPDVLVKEFVAAGGLAWVDGLNLHVYPGMTAPEAALAGLDSLQEMLRQAGAPRPIYFTEGAYYADDDLPIAPREAGGWMQQVDSELECASYLARLDLLLLAHDTKLVIYHTGIAGSLNAEPVEGIFFEWDGAPRKMAVSQSVLAALFGADVQYVGPVWEGVRSYTFHSRGRTVVAVWDEQERGHTLAPRPGATLLDLAGVEVGGPVTLGQTPYFVVLAGNRPLPEVQRLLHRVLR